MKKITVVLLVFLCGLMIGLPQAQGAGIPLFEANFENVSQGTSGDAALATQVGTFTNLQGTSPHSIVATQNTPRADFPDPEQNLLLTDAASITGIYEVRMDLTQTMNLTEGISIEYIFCHRRTNGSNKSHFVTGYDSGDNKVFEFVMADSGEFGGGTGDRQRPGYGTLSGGRVRFTTEMASGVANSYTWGADTNPSDGGDINKFASFSITINETGWDAAWIGQNSSKDGATFEKVLPFYDGTPTDLAYIVLSSESGSGGYWDNISVNGGIYKLIASNPNPDNNDTFVDPALITELSWTMGKDPNNLSVPNPDIKGHWLKLYDIHDGEPNLLSYTTSLVTDLVDPITTPISLTYGEEVYWQVDEALDDGTGNPKSVNDPNNLVGFVWYFKTIPPVPQIITPPSSVGRYPASNPAYEGDAVFSCVFSTLDPTPVVKWYKAGDPNVLMDPVDPDVTVSNMIDTPVVGQWTSTFTLANIEEADDGLYYCVVTDDESTPMSAQSDSAELIVRQQKAHWALEDSSYTDSVGSFDMVPVGDPNIVAGLIGNAMEFDGDNGLDYAFGSAQNWFTGYTVTLWTKTTAPNQGNFSGLFHMRNNGFQIDTDGAGNYRYHDGTDKNFGPVPTDEWVFLALACDGTDTTLYYYTTTVGLLAERTVTANPGVADTDFDGWGIGMNRNFGTGYTGVIDEVQVWNYAISAADVADLFYAVTNMPTCLENPEMDANDDCVVDLVDFSQFATDWLNCGLLPDCP